MFWKDEFLATRRAEWLACIDSVQFLDGNGEWKDGTIISRELDDNSIRLHTVSNNTDGKITAMRLLDSAGTVIGEKRDTLTTNSAQGVLTAWEFPIYELE